MVFGLAIRIVRFETAANRCRFDSLRTANCDSRHLRPFPVFLVSTVLLRKVMSAIKRGWVCRRGCSTTGRNSEVLKPPDPTSVFPSPWSPSAPYTRLKRYEPCCSDLNVPQCLSRSEGGTGFATISCFSRKHLAVTLQQMVHNVSARSSLHLHLGPPEARRWASRNFSLFAEAWPKPPGSSARYLREVFVAEVFRGFQRFSEIFQRFSEVFRDLQRLSEVLKPGAKNLREVFVVTRHLAECLGRHCWRFFAQSGDVVGSFSTRFLAKSSQAAYPNPIM